MKVIALILAVTCFCSLSAATTPVASAGLPPENRPAGIIVAMGDSLTEGLGVEQEMSYPALLQRALQSRGYDYRVVNAGISGETSSGARSRVAWVLRLRPDIVILATGANDGLRGIDPELIRRNIRGVVDTFLAEGIVVVLAGMKMLPNLGPAYTTRFAQIYTDVGNTTDAILIPFFLEGVAGIAEMNQPDGIHPTAEGYARVVQTILPYVIAAIRQHQQQAR